MSITGKRMQERRKQLGINADVLAEHLGVSRSTIFRYENGDIEKIPANLLSDIAKLLHTSEGFLMGWEDNPETVFSNTAPILDYYEMLNDIGKHVATERVKELTEVPRYVKDENEIPDHLSVYAAHNDAKTTDDEMEKMAMDSALIKEMVRRKKQQE